MTCACVCMYVLCVQVGADGMPHSTVGQGVDDLCMCVHVCALCAVRVLTATVGALSHTYEP